MRKRRASRWGLGDLAGCAAEWRLGSRLDPREGIDIVDSVRESPTVVHIVSSDRRPEYHNTHDLCCCFKHIYTIPRHARHAVAS